MKRYVFNKKVRTPPFFKWCPISYKCHCGNKVKAMENEIWVGTFREVVAYTKEREKNRLNVLENGYDITPHLI